MNKILLIIMLSISALAVADNVVTTAPAQIIEIDIKGMACPFCQDGLTRSLNKLPVVQQAEVSLKNKKARIIVKPGESLNEELLRQTIIDSGFTPGELRIKE
ncbi:MAG: heavy metal-associated domain-containing protein [Cycloclasticus sp.]